MLEHDKKETNSLSTLSQITQAHSLGNGSSLAGGEISPTAVSSRCINQVRIENDVLKDCASKRIFVIHLDLPQQYPYESSAEVNRYTISDLAPLFGERSAVKYLVRLVITCAYNVRDSRFIIPRLLFKNTGNGSKAHNAYVIHSA